MAYILSTLTSAQDYTFYNPNHGNAFNQPIKTIHINGGSNVADKHFITPQGVMTEISDEDLEQLRTHEMFQLHVKNGFIKILEKEKDKEKTKEDMNGADLSAPLTPETYKKKGKKAKVG